MDDISLNHNVQVYLFISTCTLNTNHRLRIMASRLKAFEKRVKAKRAVNKRKGSGKSSKREHVDSITVQRRSSDVSGKGQNITYQIITLAFSFCNKPKRYCKMDCTQSKCGQNIIKVV